MTEIKGHCRDCRWLEHETLVVVGEDEQRIIEVDVWCLMVDLFKRPDGYCDLFEPLPLGANGADR